MSGTESVVNVDITKPCHLLNEFGIVLFLPDVSAAVFKNHDFTGFYVNAVEPVFFKADRHAEHLAERFGNFCQAVLFSEFAFLRTSKVGANHHTGTAFQSHLHGRHGFFQAMIVSNVAFCISWDIHVGTNKNTLSFKRAFVDQFFKCFDFHGSFLLNQTPTKRGLIKCFKNYFALYIATAVSSILQEKPHSLSYQATAFTSVPSITLVRVASKMEEKEVWLKSEETSGSSL